jgi:hypothetical protein
MFSHEGKAALGMFLNSTVETARWFRGHIPPSQRLKLLGGLLFRVEGGLVNNRRFNKTAVRLRQLADEGFNSSIAISMALPLLMLHQDTSALTEIRASIVQKEYS